MNEQGEVLIAPTDIGKSINIEFKSLTERMQSNDVICLAFEHEEQEIK